MNQEQIRSFVMRYLEAEQCDIVEKHPAYITVKLSPSADKELTNRPYYWSFVERTGAAPETMTCTFIFDPEAYRELHPPASPGVQTAFGVGAGQPQAGTSAAVGTAAPQAGPVAASGVQQPGVAPSAGAAPQPAQQGDTILGRYFGFVPTAFTARMPRDELTFGSRRLEQIFAAVRAKGRFARLFQSYKTEQPRQALRTIPYETWFVVNYKVELVCDMKRSEMHSLGIHMSTGEIREHCQEWLTGLELTPRLPAHVYVTPDKITLPRAALYLEEHLESKLKTYDHRWAEEAQLRLKDELDRVDGYYKPLLGEVEADSKPAVEAQYANRLKEIEWQYKPRIQISVTNCGLFHLQTASAREV